MEPNKLNSDIDWVDDEGAGALLRIGFLGKAGRSGHWRLYTRPDLTEYLEFAESDLLHTAELTSAQSPIGGSMVWFRAAARLSRVSTTALDEQAAFLRGPVASGFLRASATNLGGGGFSTETIVETIISFLVACPSYWFGCTARCTVQCGVTVIGACPIYSLACTYEKRICG